MLRRNFYSLKSDQHRNILSNMQLPVKISYRGLEKSDQIDNLILDYAARIERFCDHINRCDVAIEQTNHTHQKGNPYRCRIDVTVAPRHELVADEKQTDNGTHEPLKKVIHDAFKTMERELRRVVEKQRREIKTHANTRSPK
jgi:ribosome-associated translation inhibitor RaiA